MGLESQGITRRPGERAFSIDLEGPQHAKADSMTVYEVRTGSGLSLLPPVVGGLAMWRVAGCACA